MIWKAKNIRCFGAVALLGLLGCTSPNPRVVTTLNADAALVGDLPANPLQWKVITSALDRRDSTMSTLFGNDVAVECARTSSQHGYPAGSALALVTWTQQEDRRWFGGRIPAKPKSVEYVTVNGGTGHSLSYSYQEFEGSPLKRMSAQEGPAPNERAAYLLSQQASVMP